MVGNTVGKGETACYTVGKEEIARNEQFLLFPTVYFKDLYYRHVKNQGLFGKRIKKGVDI